MAISMSSVLLIEDDPNDVLLTQRAVAKAGLGGSPHVVSDGEQAIAWLSETGTHPPPSLILLDLKLPKVSGIEVLGWVKSQPVLRRIPVIVMTSSREEHDVARAYDLGVNAYVIKPASFNELVVLMKKLAEFWIAANTYPDVSRVNIEKAKSDKPPERRNSDPPTTAVPVRHPL